MVKTYTFLVVAILFELVAVTALKSSAGFTRVWPTIIMLTCYSASMFFLSLVLKTLPLGITYAIWSGVGIVFIAIIGLFYHKEALDLPAVIGISLILAGVVILNLFSGVVNNS